MKYYKIFDARNIIIGAAIIVFIVGGWLMFFDKEINLPEETGQRQEAVLTIDYGQGNPDNFIVEFIEGATVFDALKSKTEESNTALKTKSYDIGIMIEAIGDKENGQDGKYWLYYVNGEMPMAAADSQKIKAGDKIEFKFEKSSF